MKTLSDLPQDVYKVLEGKSLFDASVVDRFGDNLKNILLARLRREDQDKYLRMSMIGKPLRQIYYDLNGYEGEKIEGKTLVKFLYGDLIEAMVICLAEASGHKVERFQEEVNVSGVPGKIDLVLDNHLVDVKSCSPYSFQKFKDGSLLESGNDPFGYLGQISGYKEAINLPAAWVAVDKVSGEICILEVPEDKINEFNVRNRIAEIRETSSRSSPPERCYSDEPHNKSGNRKLKISCSYCSHKAECWKESNGGKGLQVYYYSNGPVYLTSVIKEPKVNSEEFKSFSSNFTTKGAISTNKEEVTSQ